MTVDQEGPPVASLSVTIPTEPDDRAVVLDRDADAWQRRGDAWQRVGSVMSLFGTTSEHVLPWGRLLVERGPLAPLVTEAEVPVDGWARNSFTDPSLEHFADRIGTKPRHERTDATAADCATTRRETEAEPVDGEIVEGAGLPRVWHEGEAEPDDVAEVRDTDSHAWHRLGGDEMRHPWVRDDQRDDASWEELLRLHGPVVEPIPHAVEASTAHLPAQGRFVEATVPAPMFTPAAPSTSGAVFARPVVDRPQA